MDQLQAALQQTLSPDSDGRRAAEQQLEAMSREEGYPRMLLQMVCVRSRLLLFWGLYMMCLI